MLHNIMFPKDAEPAARPGAAGRRGRGAGVYISMLTYPALAPYRGLLRQR